METSAPAGLNHAGSFAVFAGDQGIWITNPDGSFPTRLAEQGLGKAAQDLHDALAPQGDRIAMVAAGKTGLDLITIEIPGGGMRTVSRLLDVTRSELALNSLSPKAFAYYAITDYPNLAWRPGIGEILAYVSAEKGPTADIYTFRDEGPIRRLEENPSQAVRPIWSPDGEYLLFFGVDWLPPFGPTYVTFQPMAGFWAVRISDNQVIPQSAPKGSYRNFVGWQDDSHYLIYDSEEDCSARNLRAVDVATGKASPIADFCFYSRPAWSPANGAVLLSVDSDCGCSTGEGVFLLLPGRADPIRLLDTKVLETHWLAESKLFYAYPEALFSADGSTRYDPPVRGSSYHPAVSKSGNQAWVVIENHRSRVLLQTPGGDWRSILEGGVGSMLWDPIAGETLLIAMDGGALYSANAPDFTPLMMGDLGGYYDRAAWTPVS